MSRVQATLDVAWSVSRLFHYYPADTYLNLVLLYYKSGIYFLFWFVYHKGILKDVSASICAKVCPLSKAGESYLTLYLILSLIN